MSEASEDVFHLRGRLTYEDALAGVRLEDARSNLRTWERAYRLAVILVLLAGVEYFKPVFAARPLLGAAYLLIATVLLFFPAARRWHRRRQLCLIADAGIGIFRHAESTLSPVGIATRNEYGLSSIAWNAFDELRYNKSVAVLYFAEQPGSAIIARSKLDDPERWPALIEMISKQILAREV